jgi:4-amino-4-deoxy-L-arabinose transferase-like glycosyltransferase
MSTVYWFTPQRTLILLAIILLLYLMIGAFFAIRIPDWQAPDEPAHYNYVAQVAQRGCCPIIEAGDWDQAYLESIKSVRFQPDSLSQLDQIQYEDHQPPLYYLLLSPVFQLTEGNLLALRLVSLLIGTGTLVCAYGIGITVLPHRPQVGLAAALLTAFVPQHLAMLASVNNDALANFIIALTLLATLLYLRGHEVRPWQLGLLVALGLVTKVSTVFMLGVVIIAILIRLTQAAGSPSALVKAVHLRAFLRAGLQFMLPVMLIGGVWWGRNILVYGFPDIFGLRAHDVVVVGQPRTADLIAQIGSGSYLQLALQTTFNSFWGQFGWMGVPMPTWVYSGIEVFVLLAFSGLVINHLTRTSLDPAVPETYQQRLIWGLIVLVLVLAAAQYVYYNTEFQQLQGRYMFTGLSALALVLALGVEGWRTWLVKRVPLMSNVLHPVVILLPGLAFAALDVFLLFRVIVPNLAY